MGCQPVVAENERTDSGAYWHSLQPVLRECRAVIHIVGNAYGDEPQQRQPAEHRRSYAQLEYDLAVALRRPLSIVVCTERFPFDPFPPEETDKQRLQQVHRKFVQGGGRAFQFVENQAELLSAVTALRVPGMAPIMPVLTPLPVPMPKPAAPPPLAAAAAAAAPIPPGPMPISVWLSQAPRRRLFRWIAVGLVVCILVLIVGVGVLAWMVLKREPGTALATAEPARQSSPVPMIAPAPPPAVSQPQVTSAPPVRQSSPVAIVPPAPPPAASQSPVTSISPVRPSSPAPIVAPAPIPAAPPPSPVAVARPPTPSPAELEPAKVPATVQADRSPVDAATRKAIVDRIALAPDIPPDKKEKVREIVSRAHEMRRVLVLPFASGQTELAASDATALRDLIHAPEFKAYRDDPTSAFIVLGFADMRGTDDYNLRLSNDRARNVRDLLRRDSELPNIIHPVGLGKTTLLDDQQLEKNRIVEVWVIRL